MEPAPTRALRGPVLFAGTIAFVVLLAAGVAVGAVSSLADTADGTGTGAAATADASSAEAAAAGQAPAAAAEGSAAAAPAAPGPAAPAPKAASPTTTARAKPVPSADPVSADPAVPEPATTPPTTAPAPKLAPGQRLSPTSAQVSAAAAALHGRIPLFDPTEAQLRTFADAVCTSFDQGQSAAQVQSTVQQAVSNIQGASLSAADAAFAVATVVQLRCPGYLP